MLQCIHTHVFLSRKTSCYFDTHFSHPLFVLAAFAFAPAFAVAIVVCGVVVVVVVGGLGGFGAVFFPPPLLLWL